MPEAAFIHGVRLAPRAGQNTIVCRNYLLAAAHRFLGSANRTRDLFRCVFQAFDVCIKPKNALPPLIHRSIVTIIPDILRTRPAFARAIERCNLVPIAAAVEDFDLVAIEQFANLAG